MKAAVLVFFLMLIVRQVKGNDIDTTFYDTITFETHYEYLGIDTSDGCIWQIARPQKPFFNNAFSGDKAILTDSVNPYPVNNHSYFDLKIGSFNMEWYPWDIGVAIHHKFDTDTLADGLYISISYDYGQTWTNIFEDGDGGYYYWDITPFEESYLYEINILCNGEMGFSGRSTDWVTTRFEWYYIPAKKDLNDFADTMIIRFNFVSDDIETLKEGWMIDDIYLYSVDRGGGSVRVAGESDLIKVYPNPSNTELTVELDQTYQEVKIECMGLDGEVLSDHQYFNTNAIQLGSIGHFNGMYLLRITLNHNVVIVKRVLLGN